VRWLSDVAPSESELSSTGWPASRCPARTSSPGSARRRARGPRSARSRAQPAIRRLRLARDAFTMPPCPPPRLRDLVVAEHAVRRLQIDNSGWCGTIPRCEADSRSVSGRSCGDDLPTPRRGGWIGRACGSAAACGRRWASPIRSADPHDDPAGVLRHG
jgi:hypothetical protein